MSKVKRAMYPGTFDPVTFGHLDVVARAAVMFDHVVVAVAKGSSKTTLFSIDERVTLVRDALKGASFAKAVSVQPFAGLLVDFARHERVTTLVRGLRAVSDFEYEFQMALMNRHQAPEIETVFLMPDEKFVYLSSSTVREVARFGGKLTAFLPRNVQKALKIKFSEGLKRPKFTANRA